MTNRILTQSELAVRVSRQVAVDLLRSPNRRALEQRLRPPSPPRGDAPASPVSDARPFADAVPAPREPLADSTAERRDVTAALRRAVDLFLLASEPFPGAAELQGQAAAPSDDRRADAGPELTP